MYSNRPETGHNKSNFTTVDTHIKALIGQNCDPFVLESIEKMEETLPKEPEMPVVTDETKKKMEEMKFKSKSLAHPH